MAKYKSKKVTRNGITYASVKEYKRHCELLLLERAGVITNLQTQVRFELLPAFYQEYPTGEYYKRGAKKGQPKVKRLCIEQSVNYVADFVYECGGRRIVEDAKGVRTKDYIIKRKLMLWVHGIKIKET